MPTLEQVNVSEFKAVCLRMLEEVRQTGEPIEILKNGELLAVVHPPPTVSRKGAFGSMKHTLKEPVGDLISPVENQDWEVLRP
jgi:antitoxin (DNA-binding transcriptional repressor) of toxin-antitoxin stability system